MSRAPVRLLGRIWLALLIALGGGWAAAEAPEVSLRPPARVIEPPGRPVARSEPVTEAEGTTEAANLPEPADAETDVEADQPPETGFDPEALANRLSTAQPEVAPDVLRTLAEDREVTASDTADIALLWPPEPPDRPPVRLVARPEFRLAAGPPPGRPVARPPLPPRPFYFDEIWVPRIYGAATWSPRPEISELAVAEAFRPPERPAQITRAAEAARVARQRGAVCGNPSIQGDTLGSVPGPGACGIDGAVRVRSVGGVALSTAARMDCTTARALLRWVENGARPAVGNAGGGLREIRVIGEYSCRTRNNRPGARLSEHSFGRAIDIGGFTLADGSRISVLRHWRSGTYGRVLLDMHRAACGTFGTVLGPNANAAHRDHFHFDTARYRSGSYCR